MQIAQDISLRMYVKKRRRSGLRRGFLACIIGEIAKSRCVSYFSTVPKDIVKSKCHRNVRSSIKNTAEMLQDSDISADNLPLAACLHTAAKKFTPDNRLPYIILQGA